MGWGYCSCFMEFLLSFWEKNEASSRHWTSSSPTVDPRNRHDWHPKTRPSETKGKNCLTTGQHRTKEGWPKSKIKSERCTETGRKRCCAFGKRSEGRKVWLKVTWQNRHMTRNTSPDFVSLGWLLSELDSDCSSASSLINQNHQFWLKGGRWDGECRRYPRYADSTCWQQITIWSQTSW